MVIVIIFFDSEKSTLAPNETKRSFIVCTSFTNGTFLRVILFLNKIDWPLLKLGYDERDENSQVNEFDLLYFGVDNSGGSTGSFTTIQIPKLFAGGPALKVSVEKLSKLIYENYAKKLSEILKAFPESKFGLSSSLEGPGLN